LVSHETNGKHHADETGDAVIETSQKKRLAIRDIASSCMVSTITVRRWIQRGELMAFRLPSGHYRVSAADFRDFLKRYGMPLDEEFLESKTKKERG
jgi:excisionase family DNA binding protein